MTHGTRISDFSTRPSEINGLVVISTKTVEDSRGIVRELYRDSIYPASLSMPEIQWRQINLTATQRGAVRGLHGEDMNKLVTVATGRAHGVYVDTREDSPTRGGVVQVALEPGVQVFVPKGVCNGFQAVGDGVTEYLYFFDEEWRPGMTGVALTPLDPRLGIHWPLAVDPDDRAQVSEKDAGAPHSRRYRNLILSRWAAGRISQCLPKQI